MMRHVPMEMPDDVHGDARLLRRAGAGRKKDGLRLERLDFLDGDRVVAVHDDVLAELAQILDQVIGKRIVVIDH